MGRPAGQRRRDDPDGQRRGGRTTRHLGGPDRAGGREDQPGGVPTIVSSHLDVTASIPGLDKATFDAVIGEASDLCPVSRLFVGAKITVNATLEPAP